MQANSEAFSYSQEAWRWHCSKGQKRSDNGQHRTHPRFWCGEYLCIVKTWYMQLLWSYRVHKTAWPWTSLKVQKGHTKVNFKLIWDFDVANIPIKLEHDTGNLQWSMKSYRVYKVQDADRPPTQAKTITIQPKGLRRKKDWNLLQMFRYFACVILTCNCNMIFYINLTLLYLIAYYHPHLDIHASLTSIAFCSSQQT